MKKIYFVKVENDKWFLAENIKYYFLKVPSAKLDSSEFNNMIEDKEYVFENYILYNQIARLWDELYREYRYFKKIFIMSNTWKEITVLEFANRKDVLELLDLEFDTF